MAHDESVKRTYLTRLVLPELRIHEAILLVDGMGLDPKLVEVSDLLAEALSKLHDYFESL